MNLDNELFDSIQLLAESSPRRRMHYDLRTETDAPAGVGHDYWKDQSQRILNVMMPDTVVPIHKHSFTSESIIICRGKVRVECYAEDGADLSDPDIQASINERVCEDAVDCMRASCEVIQMFDYVDEEGAVVKLRE